MVAIKFGQEVEPATLLFDADALGRLQVGNGHSPVLEAYALVNGGHETGAPVARPVGYRSCPVKEHDETRKVLVLRPKAIGCPATQGRPARQDGARVHLANAGRMIDGVAPARADHRDIIDTCGRVGQPVGNPGPALAMLPPAPFEPSSGDSNSPMLVMTRRMFEGAR